MSEKPTLYLVERTYDRTARPRIQQSERLLQDWEVALLKFFKNELPEDRHAMFLAAADARIDAVCKIISAQLPTANVEGCRQEMREHCRVAAEVFNPTPLTT